MTDTEVTEAMTPEAEAMTPAEAEALRRTRLLFGRRLRQDMERLAMLLEFIEQLDFESKRAY